jgi:restriction system protein
MATVDPSLALQPAQMSQFVSGTLLRVFASVGQYFIPFLCLLGAAMSAWRRVQRRTLVRNVQASKAAGVLDGMSWREFEMLVGEAFRLDGFRVAEAGGGGPDGGVDLVLNKGGETFLVQCKQWKALKVGVDVVRQLYGVMAARGATGGFVVTSGRFTDDARRFAEGRNLNLIDGDGLMKLTGRVRSRKESIGKSRATEANADHTSVLASRRIAGSPALTCPLCSSAMVKRLARRGANAGNALWGCSTYPACKGTRVAGS